MADEFRVWRQCQQTDKRPTLGIRGGTKNKSARVTGTRNATACPIGVPAPMLVKDYDFMAFIAFMTTQERQGSSICTDVWGASTDLWFCTDVWGASTDLWFFPTWYKHASWAPGQAGIGKTKLFGIPETSVIGLGLDA
jgi:hypothetical protein